MSLYASVLKLDRHDVSALRVTDLYSLHRVVYSLFEDVRNDEQKRSGASSGILFADQGGGRLGRCILVLSTRAPRASINGTAMNLETKEVPDTFLSGVTYRFQVTVNPTRRNNKTRKLEPVRGREAVLEWFAERAKSSWGFEVMERHSQVDKIEVIRFEHSGKGRVTIAQAQIRGCLNVLDQERFRRSVSQGIGRARSFGCGLLQLVPTTHHNLKHQGD